MNSGDLIRRQAVLDIDFHKLIHTTTKPAEMIRQKIEQLPPVNPQKNIVNNGTMNITL